MIVLNGLWNNIFNMINKKNQLCLLVDNCTEELNLLQTIFENKKKPQNAVRYNPFRNYSQQKKGLMIKIKP